MMNPEIKAIIDRFQMQAHPEGGYYVETYRSELLAADTTHSVATVIYFLLPSNETSTWHRIKSDELWFYHGGSPIVVHTIQNGEYQKNFVGPIDSIDCQPQFLVKGSTIFGASVEVENSYSLVSCVVAPGFDFADFELFSQEQMNAFFPTLEEQIACLY